MSNPLTEQTRHDLEAILEDAAKTLRRAAEDLGDDAEMAMSQATQALRQAAQALADKAGPEARHLAQKAVSEAKAHPIATAAGALSAAAALISILGIGRRKPAQP